MIAYPDTSLLFALYRFQANSERAIRYVAGMPEQVHVASPLLFEFRQAARWQVYFHGKNPAAGFSQAQANAALGKLQSNIATGGVIVAPVEWADIVSIADRLSAQHTSRGGFRAFDILHVATALHLGAREFLTFDVRQSSLAEAEGMKCPLAASV